MELIIYHANQCDPKKCWAKNGPIQSARWHSANKPAPPFLVLSPFSEKALSPADKGTEGLPPWIAAGHAEEVFSHFRLQERAFHFLLLPIL